MVKGIQSAALLALLVPLAAVQAEPFALEDGAGDARMVWPAEDGPNLDLASTADLLSVAFGLENATHVGWSYTVAQWAADRGSRHVILTFRHGENEYESVAYIQHTTGRAWAHVERQVDRSGGASPPREEAIIEVDETAAKATIWMPRDFLENHQEAPLRVGAAVEVLAWEASASSSVERYTDLAPDEGEAGTWTATIGPDEGQGDLDLLADRASVATNGDPGLLPLTLRLANRGDEQRDIGITVSSPDIPVFAPATISVSPQGEAEVPVFVQVGGGHEHGRTLMLEIHATDLELPEEHRASARLAVEFLAVPQPSPHHPWLHFHAETEKSNPNAVCPSSWMNTLAPGEDERADATELEPCHQDFVRPAEGFQSRWRLPMDPGLLVGLQPDPARVPELTLDLMVDRLLGTTSLDATLHVLCPEGGDCDSLPDSLAAGSLDFDGTAGTHRLQIPMDWIETVPLDPGAASLMLVVEATTQLPVRGPAAPALAINTVGSSLSLPLRHYSAAATVDGWNVLRVQGEPSRLVNPGAAAVFLLFLDSGVKAPLELQALGYGLENVLWPNGTRIQPGHRLPLAIVVPPESEAGLVADLAILGHSPHGAAYVRLIVESVPPDELQAPGDPVPIQTRPNKSTPGPLLLSALAVAASAWRRRG